MLGRTRSDVAVLAGQEQDRSAAGRGDAGERTQSHAPSGYYCHGSQSSSLGHRIDDLRLADSSTAAPRIGSRWLAGAGAVLDYQHTSISSMTSPRVFRLSAPKVSVSKHKHHLPPSVRTDELCHAISTACAQAAPPTVLAQPAVAALHSMPALRDAAVAASSPRSEGCEAASHTKPPADWLGALETWK